ncbi:MAG: hypothetical protein QXX55_00115 [Candidatus Pacearchaeota archaeon]
MHLKRQKSPKSWPIHRKGTKYVVRPSSNINKGIPLLIVLRDLLKIAKRRKEVKRAIYMKQILINNKLAKDEKNSLFLFDTLTIIPLKKSYRIEILENGKIGLKEIKDNESKYKISKIINKKILKGNKTQLNLLDGRNFLSEIKCNVNDSVIIDFDKNKIEKCIPLQEKSQVFVFSGRYAGQRGSVIKIDKKNKMAEVVIGNHKANILIKKIIALE